MKHIISILLLFVYSIGYSYAQTSPWEKAYNDLPRKERDEYYENARHFLRNYYEQITAAIENVEIHPFITEELIDREEAETVRYKPEFIPERGKQRILTFSQYLLEASNTFRGKSEGLEFVVSNIEEDKYVHGYNALTNCFVRLDYDLEIRLHGETLLKRPCRMCCLFPEAQYKKRVRLMQIEPLEDGVVASTISEQDDDETTKSKITEQVKGNKKEEKIDWKLIGFSIGFSVIIFIISLFYCIFEDKLKKRITTIFMRFRKKKTYHGWEYNKKKEIRRKNISYILYGIGIISMCALIGFLIYYEMNPITRICAELGYANAQNKLGNEYYVNKNFETAIKWYTKAGEQGHAGAQCYLGLCYESGEGVTKDMQKAVEWYTKAAEWYMKAAEQGDAEAQYGLGWCYYYGKGVPQNHTEAVKWYTKAAKQGHASAQYCLGICYYNGKGVPQNHTEAVKWYTKAAEQGHASAQNNLGYRYYNGEGVTQNYTEAVKWYTRAAKQGNAYAQCELGTCYYYGKGVAQNYSQAFEWYTKAANQGDAVAQYNVGICCQYGYGTTQNTAKAIEWYTKAANQGNTNAKQALARLKQP